MDGADAALLYGALSRATRRTGGSYKSGFIPSEFDVPAAEWGRFLLVLGLELGGTYTLQVGSGARAGQVLICHGERQLCTLSREMITLPHIGRGIRVGFIESPGTGGDVAAAAPAAQQPAGTTGTTAEQDTAPAESAAPAARAGRSRKAQAASS